MRIFKPLYLGVVNLESRKISILERTIFNLKECDVTMFKLMRTNILNFFEVET